jgi:RsiW-degrading membrane proteinase PrsW (M82 family)
VIYIVGFIFSVLAAFVPALVYGWFIYWLDRHEKEPWWLLAIAFGWGIIPAVILALIVQIILDVPTSWLLVNNPLAYDLVGGSLWAPLTEEVTKGIGVGLVIWLAYRYGTLDSTLDSLIYGALGGLGFALTEDFFYIFGTLFEAGVAGMVSVAFFRTVVFGLSHTLFTGLFGLGFGYAFLTRSIWMKVLAPPLGLGLGMFFHSLHNLGASLAQINCLSIFVTLFANWGGLLLMVVIIGLIWRQEKQWITSQLLDEVGTDTFSLLTRWPTWQKQRWQALLKGDLKSWRTLGLIRQTGAELAFKKQQLIAAGANTTLEAKIAQYRHKLAVLGVALPTGDQAGN